MKICINGVIRDMTAEEMAEISALPDISTGERIEELKRNLADTDYMAIKYAEGWLSDTEYAPVRAQRQAWRDEISRLTEDSK